MYNIDMEKQKTGKKTEVVHRIWARIPEEAYREMEVLSKRLGINMTKLVQISAIAGYKSIYRATFPEDSIPPEFMARMASEIDKLNKIN